MSVMRASQQGLAIIPGPRAGHSTLFNKVTGEFKVLAGLTELAFQADGKVLIKHANGEVKWALKELTKQAAVSADGRAYVVDKATKEKSWTSDLLAGFNIKYAIVRMIKTSMKVFQLKIPEGLQRWFWQPRDFQDL